MLAREEQAADAQRRLHGPRVCDPHVVRGLDRRKGRGGALRAAGQGSGQRLDGGALRGADAAAADDDAPLGRVVTAVEGLDLAAREAVVGLGGRRGAVGMAGAEQRRGKGFAGLDVNLRAVDLEPLPPLGAVGAQLLFGKGRVEEDLRGDAERLGGELREHGEVDVGVVAVEVDVVPRAVEVELFGDLLRRHRAGPLREEVRRGRGREGCLLHGRSGAEDERDAQHLELVGREQVERCTVGQQVAFCAGNVDRRRGHGLRMYHFFALYINVLLFSGRSTLRQKSRMASFVTAR